MKKLIDRLKTLSNSFSIQDMEIWKLPDSCPIAFPENNQSNYLKNIYLKDHFHEVIANDESLKSHYWAIQDWGGIGSFKKSEKNDRRIRTFLSQIDKGSLTKDTFECISSLSKVASFIRPDQFVIYDSRVIYCLNWYLFNYTNEVELFPQPAGRNKELVKLDLETIFGLSEQNYSYRSHKVAYHDYCGLMKELSLGIYGPGYKPYVLEMLLFMALNNVITEVRSSVKVEIKLS